MDNCCKSDLASTPTVYFDVRPRQVRLVFVLVTTGAYVLTFITLYSQVGPGLAAFSGLPIIAAGWLLGLRAGLAAWFLFLPVNTLLFNMVGLQGWDTLLRNGGGPGSVTTVILVAVAGRIHDLLFQLNREISEHKRTEKSLRKSTRMLELFFEYTLSQIVFLDKDYNFIRVNRSYAIECSRDLSEFSGKNYFDLCPSDTKDIFDKVVATKTAHQTVAQELIIPGHSEKGATYWDWSLVPVLDDHGEVELLVFSLNDVTDQKRAEQELRQHQDQLAHVSRVNTMGEMATGLAHELNQPLTAISTFCFVGEEILEDSSSAEAQQLQELFKKLTKQSIRASEIIRRLRALVSKRDFNRSRVNIRDPLQEVLQLFESDIRECEIQIEVHLDHSNIYVIMDEIQIQQVLVNLIRNSLDAMSETDSDQRMLTITTKITADNLIEVAVCDSGSGIASDSADQVFDAFFSSKSEGMGMGLAISRTIIESHGGRLWMTPNSDRGVTFHLTVPITKETNVDEGLDRRRTDRSLQK